MKISRFLLCALFGAFILLVSCNSKKEEPVTTDQSTVTPDSGASPFSTQAPALSDAAASAGAAFHFTCPKGCEGGGASAKGNCPVCGTELVHNQAFHAQAAKEAGSTPATSIQVDPMNAQAPGSTTPLTTTTAKPAEPPQNASGVWHYVCSKACGGGGGAQGPCPKCGADLAHNAEYHKK